MSLNLQLTVPSLHRHNRTNHTKRSTFLPITSTSRTFLQTSCVHKQSINRRSALVGLSILTTNQTLMASGAPENGSSPSQTQDLPEFGSDPRPLNNTIRVIVARPKSGFSKEDTVEVLMVEGIEVPNNNPVRFDVYVGKADGSSEMGEFAGSLIEEARLRMGRNFRKKGLSLGITNLVKEIGGEGCDKLVVSLVPRTGELSIGGVRIGHIQAQM